MRDGNGLVSTSKRSFSSILGDIVTDFRETWSLAGNVLTIEKTRTADGLSDTERAVFEKWSLAPVGHRTCGPPMKRLRPLS